VFPVHRISDNPLNSRKCSPAETILEILRKHYTATGKFALHNRGLHADNISSVDSAKDAFDKNRTTETRTNAAHAFTFTVPSTMSVRLNPPRGPVSQKSLPCQWCRGSDSQTTLNDALDETGGESFRSISDASGGATINAVDLSIG